MDEDITNQLNQVYKTAPSTLEPELLRIQLASIVDSQQRPLGHFLTPEEYTEYLDMLEDRADSEDEDLAHRLTKAATKPTDECSRLREYLHRRPPANTALQS